MSIQNQMIEPLAQELLALDSTERLEVILRICRQGKSSKRARLSRQIVQDIKARRLRENTAGWTDLPPYHLDLSNNPTTPPTIAAVESGTRMTTSNTINEEATGSSVAAGMADCTTTGNIHGGQLTMREGYTNGQSTLTPPCSGTESTNQACEDGVSQNTSPTIATSNNRTSRVKGSLSKIGRLLIFGHLCL
ncbi:hypothetical protein BX600DRAFT_284576 [Xylariales sp. PMI_506]|nr:hypothetical protein BX600DRAFT_284576 [Xylariales sp. PMI_506]